MVTKAKPPPEPSKKPGIYFDIPINDYHAGPGVSKSQLDYIAKAPGLLQWARNAPRDEEARAAVDIGSALDAFLLEPDTFDDLFVVEYQAPACALNTADDMRTALDRLGIGYTTKDSKQALVAKLLEADPDAPVSDRLREQWEAGARGKTVLTTAEYRKVMLMRDSVMAHPDARRIIEAPGHVQASYYFTDPETGELCRCRPDKRAEIGGRMWTMDLKISADVDEFWRAVEAYRYDVQDQFYGHGTKTLTGEASPFVFTVVSSQRSAGRYPVRCYTLPGFMRDEGATKMRADLNKYAECKRAGIWPGIETVARPVWAKSAA